jgi:hypothetical protein
MPEKPDQERQQPERQRRHDEENQRSKPTMLFSSLLGHWEMGSAFKAQRFKVSDAKFRNPHSASGKH